MVGRVEIDSCFQETDITVEVLEPTTPDPRLAVSLGTFTGIKLKSSH